MSSDAVSICLTVDEALVLFEWIHRMEDNDAEELLVAFPGELGALRRLAGALESAVPTVFDPDYVGLVEAARQRMAEKYEAR